MGEPGQCRTDDISWLDFQIVYRDGAEGMPRVQDGQDELIPAVNAAVQVVQKVGSPAPHSRIGHRQKP